MTVTSDAALLCPIPVGYSDAPQSASQVRRWSITKSVWGSRRGVSGTPLSASGTWSATLVPCTGAQSCYRSPIDNTLRPRKMGLKEGSAVVLRSSLHPQPGSLSSAGLESGGKPSHHGRNDMTLTAVVRSLSRQARCGGFSLDRTPGSRWNYRRDPVARSKSRDLFSISARG